MNRQDPIRIDSFRADAIRVRSGMVARQYRISMTLAAMLLLACGTLLVTSHVSAPQAQAFSQLTTLFGIN